MDVHHLYRGNWARPVPAALTHLAAMLGLCFLCGARGPLTLNVVGFLFGWGAWTLFEYCLHRFFLHSRNPWIWKTFHHGHHTMQSMHDAEHRLLHPGAAVPIIGGFAFLASRMGVPVILPVGFWFGYVIYELIHWVDHNERLSNWLRRFVYFQRRLALHDTHHFRRANVHYGFTTGFWDALFGTWYEPDPVRR